MTPEFSRPERIDAIGEGERRVTIAANEQERAAVAARFGLVSIERLEASVAVQRESAGIAVRGTVSAQLVQACSITDDPLPVAIEEAVALSYVESLERAEEVELGEELLDMVEIEGSAIDLGEMAAETMALALDPFPRGPHAAAALKEAGVLSEEEAKPVSALAGLKALLGKE